MENRRIYQQIWNSLASEKPLILLTGPRQAGKTTLSKLISQDYSNYLYINWDISADRIRFLENPEYFRELSRKDDSKPLIVFDELHKYKDWKNYLKGIYDGLHEEYRFLVAGSGRLDTYQKGADSLAGRYLLLHLWPMTLAELGQANKSIEEFSKDPLKIQIEHHGMLAELWENLKEHSGFPEPFLSAKKTSYRRWSNIYSKQLIREDIRDQTEIKSILDVETLYMLLPSKVGSPLSIPSLSRDLKVAYNSINNWLVTFEAFFLTFTIAPWTRRIPRSIQKEKKLYLWDSPRIKSKAARFENMVALELYRAIHSWNDCGYGDFSLHYLRNKEHQEVDFLISNEQEPFLMIETKLNETDVSPVLKKFQNQLQIPAIQLTESGDSYRLLPNKGRQILIAPAYHWLAGLP
jgi:uncharacterized protein